MSSPLYVPPPRQEKPGLTTFEHPLHPVPVMELANPEGLDIIHTMRTARVPGDDLQALCEFVELMQHAIIVLAECLDRLEEQLHVEPPRRNDDDDDADHRDTAPGVIES
jgi:hypothetical protein